MADAAILAGLGRDGDLHFVKLLSMAVDWQYKTPTWLYTEE